MILTKPGLERALLSMRLEAKPRYLLRILALLIFAFSFGAAYVTATGHFFVLTLASVVLVAWTSGFRVGVLAGVAVPLLSMQS